MVIHSVQTRTVAKYVVELVDKVVQTWDNVEVPVTYKFYSKDFYTVC